MGLPKWTGRWMVGGVGKWNEIHVILAFFGTFFKAHGDNTCKVFFFWGGTMDEFDGFSMTRVFFSSDLLDATI